MRTFPLITTKLPRLALRLLLDNPKQVWDVHREVRLLFEQHHAYVLADKGLPLMRKKAWQETTFVNYRLSAEQKEMFEVWFADNQVDIDSFIDAAVIEGNRLGLTYDNVNKVYIASLTCRDEGSPNLGCCLTARYDSPLTAIACVIYKALVCLTETNWDSVQAANDFG